MKTKSVLTTLSLVLLCSSTAFGMGPRLLTFVAGAAAGASPFVIHQIREEIERMKARKKSWDEATQKSEKYWKQVHQKEEEKKKGR